MTTLFDDPNMGMYENQGGILQNPGQDAPGISLSDSQPTQPSQPSGDFAGALEGFGAGFQGRVPLSVTLAKQKRDEKLQKLQELKMFHDFSNDTLDQADRLTGEARTKYIDMRAKMGDDAMPGSGDVIKTLGLDPGYGKMFMQIGDRSPTLKLALESGGIKGARDLMKSPEGAKLVKGEIESASLPAIRQKLQSLGMAAKDLLSPERYRQMQEDGVISPSEIAEINNAAKGDKRYSVAALSDEEARIASQYEDATYGMAGLATSKTAQEIMKKKGEKNSPLGQLISERDALPADSPNRKSYDEAITRSAQGTEHDTMNERAMERMRKLQIKVNKGSRLSEEEQLQAEQDRALLSQQHMGIDPVTNQPYFTQPITIPSSITVGQGKGGKAVNTVPPTSGGRKPLDAGTEKDLTQMGDLKSLQDNVIKNFKDDYVGFTVPGTGHLAFEAGRRGLDQYKGMAEWWQNYSNWTNQVRHTLYGSALTKNEQEAFEKSIVGYSDNKDVAKVNFEKQQKIVNSALARRLKSVEVSGQNSKQAEALVNTPEVKAAPGAGNPTGTPIQWSPADEQRLQELETKQQQKATASPTAHTDNSAVIAAAHAAYLKASDEYQSAIMKSGATPETEAMKKRLDMLLDIYHKLQTK